MPVAWPASLPQSFQTEGFERLYPENRIRTETDSGPPKLRRRSSQNVGKISGQMVFTRAQKDTLDTFIDSTLIGGTQQFEFPDPVSGTLTVRLGEALPRTTVFTPLTWLITLELEILP